MNYDENDEREAAAWARAREMVARKVEPPSEPSLADLVRSLAPKRVLELVPEPDPEEERQKREAREHKQREHRVERAASAFTRTLPLEYLSALDNVRQRVSGRVDLVQLALSDWAVFVGPAGAGKTTLAVAGAFGFVRRTAAFGAFIDAYRLGAARQRHPLGEGEPPLVESAMSAEFLVLDDVGAERSTQTNAVPDVIYERHAKQLPTWITTGLTLLQAKDRYGDGVGRRMFERTLRVELGK